MQEIIIKKIEAPPKPNLEQDISFMAKSFGIDGPRDKEGTANRIFSAIILSTPKKPGYKSDELADICNLTRGAIIHHIHNLISSGIIIKEDGFYTMRSKSLRKTVEEIEQDMMRIFFDLKKIATDIDEMLGISYR